MSGSTSALCTQLLRLICALMCLRSVPYTSAVDSNTWYGDMWHTSMLVLARQQHSMTTATFVLQDDCWPVQTDNNNAICMHSLMSLLKSESEEGRILYLRFVKEASHLQNTSPGKKHARLMQTYSHLWKFAASSSREATAIHDEVLRKMTPHVPGRTKNPVKEVFHHLWRPHSVFVSSQNLISCCKFSTKSAVLKRDHVQCSQRCWREAAHQCPWWLLGWPPYSPTRACPGLLQPAHTNHKPVQTLASPVMSTYHKTIQTPLQALQVAHQSYARQVLETMSRCKLVYLQPLWKVDALDDTAKPDRSAEVDPDNYIMRCCVDSVLLPLG